LLIKKFEKVDLLEYSKELINEAKSFVNDDKLINLYNIGLQEFKPDDGKYDLIWIQWCISQLKDDDFIKSLKNCRKGLKKGGIICLKENVYSNGFFFDVDGLFFLIFKILLLLGVNFILIICLKKEALKLSKRFIKKIFLIIY
jgi:SAM-dependent methyltransferase